MADPNTMPPPAPQPMPAPTPVVAPVPGATTPGYPLAKPAPAPAVAIQDGCVVYAQATPRELTPAEQEGVQTLYDELKPQATDAARNFVLARTKAEWQEAMSALIDADWPLPEPPVV